MKGIVIDTSALLAILYQEREAETIATIAHYADTRLVSAGTLAEAMVITAARSQTQELETLIAAIAPEIVPVTSATARAVGKAYARFGKGIDKAALNYGDCFAYTLASERKLPLLFAGSDFTKTDVVPALET